jgi:DNA polymerase III sliding clamp (beta) subunit (PCNA family)
MKKIILLLVIFIFALSGCAQNTTEKDVIDENVITNDEKITISGEIEEVEENEIVIESMDEYLERKNINKEDSEYDFDEMHTAFNYKYVLDGLKNMDTKNVEIEISDTLAASIFKPQGDMNNYICLIMPVKVQ